MPKILRLSLIHFLWNLPLLIFVLWLASYMFLRTWTEFLLLAEERLPEGTVFLLLVRDANHPEEGRYFAGRRAKDGKWTGRWLLPFYRGFFQMEYRLPMLAGSRYGKFSDTAFSWAALLTLLTGLITLVLSIIGTVELFRGFGSKPALSRTSG